MPQIFGLAHFLYLLCSIIICITATVLIKKYVKTEKQLSIVIRIVAGLLLLSILWNRYAVASNRNGFQYYMPSSWCGTTSLFLSLIALFFKKNNAALHCVSYVAILGGIITLVYPDFIGQADSIFYSMTISGLVHHTIGLYLAVLMIITNYLKPELKKWHYLLLGLSLYITYGVFLITVLGYSDALLIFSPILAGTPLNWIVMGAMFLVLHLGFLLIWEKYNSRLPRLLSL